MESRNQAIDLIKIIAMIGVISLHTYINRTNELSGFFISNIWLEYTTSCQEIIFTFGSLFLYIYGRLYL